VIASRFSRTLLILGCALAGATQMLAQFSRASVIGQVTDSTNAAIPNATVTIIRLDTNERQETSSDASGGFSFAFLNPGVYRVVAAAPGFKSLERNHLQLASDDTVALPLSLAVGDVHEQVSVEAHSDPLDTSNASHFTRLNPQKLVELPIMGRQAYSLVALTPGVIFTQEQFGTTGFAGLHGWEADGKFIINGGIVGTNQFLLNGAPVSLTGSWQFSPNLDGVEEFRVLTNTYDAQYGRTGGGTVMTTLKSGTNAWHGNVFEYFHNSVLDANSTQNNEAGQPRGKHNTHDFGGTVGGPLRLNHDFIFFSYEGFREIVPFPVVSDTPPVALRTGSGFKADSIRIYDPLTAHECVVGKDTSGTNACLASYIRTPFPNSAIPLSRISPIGKEILNLYPAADGPGLTQNYIAGGNVGRYHYDQPMGRWDHLFNDRDRVSAVVTGERGHDFTSTNGFAPPAEVGNQTDYRFDQNYIAEYTHIQSPSTVFNVRASFGRFSEFFPDSSGASNLTAAQLGMINMIHAPTVTADAPPSFDLSTYSSIIGNTYSWSTQNQWSVQPGMIQTRGRHVIHYGIEFSYAAIGNAGPGRANGEFAFTPGWSQQYVNHNTGAKDGSGIADLLLGLPDTGFVDYNDSAYRTWPYFAGYVQDTWRATPKLTVTMGLRYDVQIPFIERYNRINAGFNYNSLNPLSSQVMANWSADTATYNATNPKFAFPAAPVSLTGSQLFAAPGNRRPYNTDWTDVQPRFGIAYSFAPKTVLRLGSGIFYRTATQLNETTGFSQRTNYISSFNAGVTPSAGLTGPYSLQQPFPSGILAPTGAGGGALTNVGGDIQYDGRSRPIPRTYQYSVGIEREFPWALLVEAYYSGSQTVHDSVTVEYDAPPAADYTKYKSNATFFTRNVPNPFYGILPATSALGASSQIQAYNLLRPYPLFNGIEELTDPQARYRYDSFQVFAQRKFSSLSDAGVFTFLLAYTYSKSTAENHRIDPWNLQQPLLTDLSTLDKPNVLALTGLWDLPIGWGKRWFADVGRFGGAMLNGWAVDWTLTYASGYPVPRPDANFTCSSFNTPGGQTAYQYFNTTKGCWKAYGPYDPRLLPDILPGIRNPAAPQLNVSVEKTFWLSDRYTLQFRGEAYNVTNTPILPAPNTTFGDPTFGQLPIQQNNFPRFIQLAAKIVF
jgi:Carboxypeptidase regulatory-like domain